MNLRRCCALLTLSVAIGLMPALGGTAFADDCGIYCSRGDANGNGESFDSTLIIADGGGSAHRVGHGGGLCAGCHIETTPACMPNGIVVDANGNVVSINDALCGAAVNSCRDRGGGILYHVYLVHPNGVVDHLGTECLGGNRRIVTVAQVRVNVAQYFDSVRPPVPTLTFQPPNGAVTGVPAIFHADAQTLPASAIGPFGLRVTVHPKTFEWHWDFGDGAMKVTTTPGLAYSGAGQDYITHTYSKTGSRSVSLTVVWSATYDIEGVATGLPVAGQVTATASRSVTVQQARSVLVDGGH